MRSTIRRLAAIGLRSRWLAVGVLKGLSIAAPPGLFAVWAAQPGQPGWLYALGGIVISGALLVLFLRLVDILERRRERVR